MFVVVECFYFTHFNVHSELNFSTTIEKKQI